jgi:hypothetical protein
LFDPVTKFGSSAKHFGDDENQKRAAQSPAQQQVDDRKANGAKQGCDFSDHSILGVIVEYGRWVGFPKGLCVTVSLMLCQQFSSNHTFRFDI